MASALGIEWLMLCSCRVLQYDEQDSSIRSSRQDLLRSLHQVLFDMVSHVASASFYVPEPCLPEEATKHLAGSLSSLTAQQVCQVGCSMLLPAACCIQKQLHNPIVSEVVSACIGTTAWF